MIKPYEHTAQYYETDQMGIIHHSNYIRWMESARLDYLNQIGCSYKEMEELGIISPVLSVSCEYKMPVRFGETVFIEIKVLKYDGVRFEVAYKMYNKETGELCTQCTSKHCFLSKDMKPISLKRSFLQLHEKILEGIEDDMKNV